jgi:Xaa-Pro aminopeptidase
MAKKIITKPTAKKNNNATKTPVKSTVSKPTVAKATVRNTVAKKPTVKKELVKDTNVKLVKVKTPPAKTITIEQKPYPKTIDKRFHQLRYNMEDNKVNCVFVSHLPNIRYFTNFSGSAAAMLVFNDEIHFFTDDRYEEQVKEELYPLHNLQVHITRDIWDYCVKKKIVKKIKSLGVESEYLTYDEVLAIRQIVHSNSARFKTVKNLVEKYTQPKSPEELEFIKKSCNIAERVFEHILGFIKPGMTELDVAIEIDYHSRKLGSEGAAFDTIVTSGARGALVHGQPSTKKIKKGDIVLMDFGCKVNGFCSDITRTICVGKATKEQKDIYDLLYRAMSAAIDEVRPGMKGNFLDNVARSIIVKAGFGDNFKHSLGHGIGLLCHEKPTITYRLEDQIVPEDVVLAIEPGIYLPEQFGMRVEDNVLVAKGGNIKLTNAPDKLIEI